MKKLFSIEKESIKRPEIMHSEKYIQCRLNRTCFERAIFEMGPNCNLNCPHCGAECSPNKKGLPKARIVGKSLCDLINYASKGRHPVRVYLTNGEPIREENRQVLDVFCQASEYVPLTIISNGKFAESYDSSKAWMEFMKSRGLNPSSKLGHALDISLGAPYLPVKRENHGNIVRSLRDVFPKTDIGKFLFFILILMDDLKEGMNIGNEALKEIYSVLGQRRSEYYGEKDGERFVHIYPKEGSPIMIDLAHCKPTGRAYGFNWLSKFYPEKEIKFSDVGIDASPGDNFEISHTGDVMLTNCRSNVSRQKPYGNVETEEVGTILERIKADDFFKAYRLAGVPFIYWSAQKVNPDFKVTGRTGEDVYRAIVQNEDIKSEIRQLFGLEGVMSNYHNFVNDYIPFLQNNKK
jgi:hypothetical protein